MRRAVLVLLLSLLVGQALGLDRVVGEDACAQGCSDDGDGRRCPPSCPTCECSLRPATLLPAVPGTLVRLPPRPAARFVTPDRTPRDPEPREILHVPIAALV